MRRLFLTTGLVATLLGVACQQRLAGPYSTREHGIHYECGPFGGCGEPLRCMETQVGETRYRSCEQACATDADCPRGFGCGPLRQSSQQVCLRRLPDGALLQPYFDS